MGVSKEFKVSLLPELEAVADEALKVNILNGRVPPKIYVVNIHRRLDVEMP